MQQNNIVQQQYVRTDTGPSHSHAPPTIRAANRDRKSEPIAPVPAVGADRMNVQLPGRRFPPRHFRFRSPSTLYGATRERQDTFCFRPESRYAAVATVHNSALDIALGGINIYAKICVLSYLGQHIIHARGYLLQLSTCKFEKF